MEGHVNYCENSDKWVLITPGGEIIIINKLVYGIAPFLIEWDEVYGAGEYIKINLEVKIDTN